MYVLCIVKENRTFTFLKLYNHILERDVSQLVQLGNSKMSHISG